MHQSVMIIIRTNKTRSLAEYPIHQFILLPHRNIFVWFIFFKFTFIFPALMVYNNSIDHFAFEQSQTFLTISILNFNWKTPFIGIWFHYSVSLLNSSPVFFFIPNQKVWIDLALVIVHLVQYDELTRLSSLNEWTLFRLRIELMSTTSSKHMKSLIPFGEYDIIALKWFVVLVTLCTLLCATSNNLQTEMWTVSFLTWFVTYPFM